MNTQQPDKVLRAMMDENAGLEVTRLALVTLLKLQPPEIKAAFLSAFQTNCETVE